MIIVEQFHFELVHMFYCHKVNWEIIIGCNIVLEYTNKIKYKKLGNGFKFVFKCKGGVVTYHIELVPYSEQNTVTHLKHHNEI